MSWLSSSDRTANRQPAAWPRTQAFLSAKLLLKTKLIQESERRINNTLTPPARLLVNPPGSCRSQYGGAVRPPSRVMSGYIVTIRRLDPTYICGGGVLRMVTWLHQYLVIRFGLHLWHCPKIEKANAGHCPLTSQRSLYLLRAVALAGPLTGDIG